MKKLVSRSKQVLVTYGDEQDYKQMVRDFIAKDYAIKSTFQKDYVHAVFVGFEMRVVFNANVTCAAAFISSGGKNQPWREL